MSFLTASSETGLKAERGVPENLGERERIDWSRGGKLSRILRIFVLKKLANMSGRDFKSETVGRVAGVILPRRDDMLWKSCLHVVEPVTREE